MGVLDWIIDTYKAENERPFLDLDLDLGWIFVFISSQLIVSRIEIHPAQNSHLGFIRTKSQDNSLVELVQFLKWRKFWDLKFCDWPKFFKN